MMNNDFFTLLTAVGKAKLAAAASGGAPLKLSQMAVGEGDNGAYYTPAESQTALKSEAWRAGLNHLSTDPANPNWIVAELVIPDQVGGFTIREVGVFDADGALFAVGKFPESYKPVLADGANKQLYVRMILEVSNAAAVTLMVDPSVVLATRGSVDQRIAEELAKLDGKPSVRAATTAPITLTGLQTVDGVVLQLGDRVLVKNQAAGADNGIYVAGAGNWARAADANISLEVTPGLFVAVEQGAANGGAIWQLLDAGAPVTLGKTPLSFERVSGRTGVSAGSYNRVTVGARGEVLGGSQLVAFDPAQTFPIQAYRRNLLINGGFDIWQRGLSQTTTGYGSADRWLMDLGSGLPGVTMAKMDASVADTEALGGATSFLRLTLAKAPSSKVREYCQINQRVENLRRFSGKQLTLSFWARADKPCSILAYVEQWFSAPYVEAVKNRALNSTAANLSSSWQRFSFTFTSPSLQGRAIGSQGDDCLSVFIGLSYSDALPELNAIATAQTGAFDIAQVQLEEGPVATPFEYRPFGDELRSCQRYFEKSYPLGDMPGKNYGPESAQKPAILAKMFHLNAGAVSIAPINTTTPFLVEKRIPPSVVFYDGLGAAGKMATSLGNGVDISVSSSFTRFVNPIPVFAANTSWIAYHWTADAEI
ncbi:phage tail protein [Chromobacterium piscinae]|uniref:phage tail protein n=2 Tax=Chromobacterium piscinae TaxID=686831 RepID=UPI00196AA620|nr:phage tail protein [Chromobacterium piscinae]MBX9299260.1 phage tail protein [Chromobacterium vaccinii]MBX9359367.1 phage tail protein [Chromobacterium vaccinii]MCD4503654.1 phage tail protein [Chromobacterium piscinae]MCD5326900.1 phage tail protein [Chromobacterium piscinae]